eukprot:6177184-Alexandrium_andersonii.AAC.1
MAAVETSPLPNRNALGAMVVFGSGVCKELFCHTSCSSLAASMVASEVVQPESRMPQPGASSESACKQSSSSGEVK